MNQENCYNKKELLSLFADLNWFMYFQKGEGATTETILQPVCFTISKGLSKDLSKDSPTDLSTESLKNEEKKETQWFYLDMEFKVQGPFEQKEMRDWFLDDFFPPYLFISREQDLIFSPLNQVYPYEKTTFLPDSIPQFPDYQTQIGSFPSQISWYTQKKLIQIFGQK
ncbi:gigyf family protein [Anaeramoeba ignava]|uniref:Gigyf family protein n=1 Tax=Anaeramoeba ignava TaxID=1746090 RepID=A0A9Q0LI33_ANAIG|nr:gigyf family protein [Anaeramoeba ignava]